MLQQRLQRQSTEAITPAAFVDRVRTACGLQLSSVRSGGRVFSL
jgi:hypothetical protein